MQAGMARGLEIRVFLLYTFFQNSEPGILPVARETWTRVEQSFFLERWTGAFFSH